MTAAKPCASAWERDRARQLHWLALALLVSGLVWRGARYFLAFPIWGDEAYLLTNYFTRGFADLLGPIDHCQIAPWLFHVAELACYHWLGPTDLTMRLPAFLASLGSLALFWRLSRLTLPPLGHALAVGTLAVSIWPVSMGALAKPYAFDLFFSLALLVPAVTWLQQPRRHFPLVALALIAPIAMIGSYPAAFVGGGIGLTLLPHVWRQRDVRTWGLFALYGALLVGSFGGHYLLVGRPHMASPASNITTGEGMTIYWDKGFPPSNPLRFLTWLLVGHIGQAAAYPLGSANGGSVLTVVFAYFGLVWFWKNQQRPLVWLIVSTFAVWFVAGCLRKYPFACACRLAQHVAPFYCLLAGLGVAVVLLRLRRENLRQVGLFMVAGGLFLLGVGGTVRDIRQPFRDEATRGFRAVADELFREAGDDPIVVLQPSEGVESVLRWYVGIHGSQVTWGEALDWSAVAERHDSVWVVCYGPHGNDGPVLESRLSQAGETWRCVLRRSFVSWGYNPRAWNEFCGFYHLVKGPNAGITE